ncbi:molybdopterin/thiamine biosynthesis adenylyltransferase [Lipingzhangella halophila]|uniref:Molybdopterin/thiamine biosynthesis adenylyltransferase n=1 Tax=Lipingzhangella halophila TaxID=1783352 RepID=A0A7W7W2G2_9ACTN|nr:ThiF family adenylyltransferase [Lipingzhangella halophila]MBB4931741.1 molybdopterin/thiamine biosynthesis adenylyltransferase [Lipingzhangella halophila]
MRVLFCGVGALGSTAATLCRTLPAELAFVDHDRVESRNLLSQAYTKQAVGRNKAEALRLQLRNFYGVTAVAFGVRLERSNVATLAGSADLLVDCLDNEAGRSVLSGHARSAGTPLVHAGISGDGTFGLVRWDERFTPDPEDTPGQATCAGGEHLPMIGQLSAALARVVQDFVAQGTRRDAMVTLTSVTVQ